ncbi:hypothetical protein CJ673_07855 [Aliarcobacter cryaerophilus]|uniref:S-layer protein n=1 Tax=Aliarcobacter cryaerophilus TaxID=28198 RepID=A0A2S9T4X7_9BACT|nr:calcium-binding protein [Aliarcobacter cryaerophilus]PRM93880.1 hypothetical protein CJ673_07855 [Aliarcobacter cryaerophilus]
MNDSITDATKTDTDTLNAEILGGAAIGTTTKITNVENINLSVLSGAATVDATNVTGFEKLYTNASAGTLTVSNLTNLNAEYGMKSSTGGLSLGFTAAAVAGANDAVDVTLDNITNGGNLTLVAGVETLNIHTANAATKLASITDTGTNIKTITVDGGKDFTVTAALDAATTTVDARKAGATKLEVSAGTVAVLTGSSNDTITKGTAVISGSDLFNLGAGTDTLVVDFVNAAAATATYIGVENIIAKATGAMSFDMTNADQAVAIDFQNGAAASAMNLVSGSTVKNSTLDSSTATMAIGFQNTVMGEATTLDLAKGALSVAATNVKDLTINYGYNSALAVALDETASSEVTTSLVMNTNAGTMTTGAITGSSKMTDFTLNAKVASTLTTLNETEALKNLTLNASTGAITVSAKIGTGITSAYVDTINIDATGGNVTTVGLEAANANGISLIDIAATGGTFTDGAAGLFSNTAGAIKSVVLSGSKAIEADFSAAGSKNVDSFVSTATGDVTSTITNAGVAGSTGSTVTLGNAVFGKLNTITMVGDVKNTITGGTGVDKITSANGNDTINGGAGNDTINAAGGSDTVTLGAGADIYVLAAAAGTGTGGTTAAALANSHDVITDFKGAGTDGDIIDGTGAILLSNINATVGATTAATNGFGLVTAWATTSSSATLADKITIVEATIAGGTNVLNEALLFADSGKSYLFISDGVDGIGADDILIELTGVPASTGITLATDATLGYNVITQIA